jgi:hypothetical protein
MPITTATRLFDAMIFSRTLNQKGILMYLSPKCKSVYAGLGCQPTPPFHAGCRRRQSFGLWTTADGAGVRAVPMILSGVVPAIQFKVAV